MQNQLSLPHDHGNRKSKDVELLSEMLGETANFQTVSDIFRQLSDSNRVRIFWLLCHCEECVINISSLMKMTSPAISHHLSLLKSSGLIVSRRDGKEVYYKAAETEQSRLLHLAIERVLSISCPDFQMAEHERRLDTPLYRAEYFDIIKSVHDRLTNDLSKRITIEELSKEYLVNPTTLKAVFKSVYGNSVAAHIKEHRMKKAAELLCSGDLSISQIASAVGYENQSKFSAAFKEFYGVLPTEYRKRR